MCSPGTKNKYVLGFLLRAVLFTPAWRSVRNNALVAFEWKNVDTQNVIEFENYFWKMLGRSVFDLILLLIVFCFVF